MKNAKCEQRVANVRERIQRGCVKNVMQSEKIKIHLCPSATSVDKKGKNHDHKSR